MAGAGTAGKSGLVAGRGVCVFHLSYSRYHGTSVSVVASPCRTCQGADVPHPQLDRKVGYVGNASKAAP